MCFLQNVWDLCSACRAKVHLSCFMKILFLYGIRECSERGSYMVWKINMGVCSRLEFDNIMLLNCLGYDFYVYGAFEFLCNSITNLRRHA